ncbi:unnamed protein product [Polarella glacialis]|uniref:JmjC domain-containing protein n=1 Tax=Polarella glacialis TaxID=89957 RepID=A0A813FMV4_POLGL|nr:unnamed protein product [Polarella glacialis]
MAKYGSMRVSPSDLHRGCNLAAGVRLNRTSVRHAAAAIGGGCCYLQPHHSLPQSVRNDFSVPDVLAGVLLHGPSLSIGGPGSSAVLHRHEEAWMAQVHGHKLWLVGPPGGDLPPWTLAAPCDHHPSASSWRASAKTFGAQSPEGFLPLRRCVAGPSDVVYLPDRWAHATCGLSSFNVGVGFIGSVAFLPKLHKAAATGDHLAAQAFLQRNGAEEAQQPDGSDALGTGGLLPLHWAAWNGHARLVAVLLNDSHSEGASQALRWAAARGHQAVTSKLLASGVAAEGGDDMGANPVHWAAAAGHAPVLSLLLAKRADPNAADAVGARPAHFLAGEGHLATLLVLSAWRADLRARDLEGLTPAHAAARFGHAELLRALAKRGADLEAVSDAGIRPVHLAQASGHRAAAALLRSRAAAAAVAVGQQLDRSGRHRKTTHTHTKGSLARAARDLLIT